MVDKKRIAHDAKKTQRKLLGAVGETVGRMQMQTDRKRQDVSTSQDAVDGVRDAVPEPGDDDRRR
ncbi:hypothetical protein SAMN05519103_08948 [Rhizobiales bacterium GAS113]|nr:hypothetical protein SAMN05519103_08948 [Rhizobiales bacterium GAS113]